MNQIPFIKTGTGTTEVIYPSNVPVITFKQLNHISCITHGFSTRLGGVSKAPFDSMNLSFTRGNDHQDVLSNFKLFGSAIGIDCANMVFTHQTHTTNLKVVTEEDLGKGILKPQNYQDIDGFVTNCKNVGLVTFYADCVPLYFVDPKKQVIGLSHSGWRGTVGKIGQKTIELMTREFGCCPEDIYTAIGPSICKDCYEISGDVAKKFQEAFTGEQYNAMMTDKGQDKYMLDLWKANKCVMEDAGILPEHISVTDICTCCNSDYMWSHRKTGATRGSLAGFLMLI